MVKIKGDFGNMDKIESKLQSEQLATYWGKSHANSLFAKKC